MTSPALTPQVRAEQNNVVIEQFRANQGAVGGRYEGKPIVLLHNVGARSGATRVNPMGYFEADDRLFVIASNGGASTHPDWYHNIRANPRATAEIGKTTFPVTARVLDGEERDRYFAVIAEANPVFVGYQRSAGERVLPVIELVRD